MKIMTGLPYLSFRLVTHFALVIMGLGFGMGAIAQNPGGHHPPKTWSIKSVVAVPAKTDNSPDRKKLGLSEEVTLSIDPPSTTGASGATWRITQGGGTLNGNAGPTVKYSAQPTAGHVQIEAAIGTTSKSVDFTIVAPQGVRGLSVAHVNPSPFRTILKSTTSLRIEIEILPADVSFNKVRFREQVGTQTTTGDWSIATWTPPPIHQPRAYDYSPANNTFADLAMSEVGRETLAPRTPWPRGSYTWHIPWDYWADGGAETIGAFSYDQTCTFTPQGDDTVIIRIDKFGQSGNN